MPLSFNHYSQITRQWFLFYFSSRVYELWKSTQLRSRLKTCKACSFWGAPGHWKSKFCFLAFQGPILWKFSCLLPEVVSSFFQVTEKKCIAIMTVIKYFLGTYQGFQINMSKLLHPAPLYQKLAWLLMLHERKPKLLINSGKDGLSILTQRILSNFLS